MNLPEIAKHRLINQQITTTKLQSAKEVVGWMGAMQAQDYPMAKWAVGVRLAGATDSAIEQAIHHGDIIRTHVLRPTWHFVSAENVYWMLALTAPHIKASMKARYKELELSEAIFSQSTAILEKALRDGNYLTREDLVAQLETAQIATDDNRAYHLIFQAELESILGSGPIRAGKQTYALLEERIPKPQPLAREEALARLARLYFTSHGPATLQDFVWWSGLPVGDAKKGLEAIKSDFVTETIATTTYWHSPSASQTHQETVHLLPAFDEFFISYRDRSAVLPFENHIKTISNNGMFHPMIVVNGQIIGIWKRTFKKDKVLIAPQFFGTPDHRLIEQAAAHYGQFLEKEVEILQ